MNTTMAIGLAVLCSAGFALAVVAAWLACSLAFAIARWALSMED